LSRAGWPRARRVLSGLRHAFALDGPHGPLTEADRQLLGRLAAFIVRRRLGPAAILFIESLRPLNYIGSQALLFLRPFVVPFLKEAEYERLAAILERREGLGALIEAIETEQSSRTQARSATQPPRPNAQ
jgi:hypothetical protein